MALVPVRLDDLTWEEMVTSIRRRIPAASAGRWTLHAPVDPGVTLLELFAWQLEQRLYWMNQVPDSLVRAALALLGVSPRPARPAATVFALTSNSAFRPVPAGTELALAGSAPPLTFTTETGTAVLPVARIGLVAGGRERGADLERGRPVPLLAADGGAAEARIVLWLRAAPPAPPPAERLALLLELEVPAEVPAQWSPDAAEEVEPPSAVTWCYGSRAGGPRPFAADQVEDGTGGLRRSGVVRLAVPADWAPSGPPDAAGLVPHALTLRTARSTFTAPPRLVRLAANAVIARHWRHLVVPAEALERQAARWLPLPGLALELGGSAPPLAETVALSLRERGGEWQEWSPVSDLAFHGPEDRVFTVDREARALRFGDGLTGRVPVLAPAAGGPRLEISYRAGAGDAGNVGSGRAWEAAGLPDLAAVNAVAAAGGAEAESLEAARRRAAAELKARQRAVTPIDYEQLAATTLGVAIARAHAAIGHHPQHPCVPVPGAVTVFPVPHAPRTGEWGESAEAGFAAPAPQPDPGALAAVARRLEAARLIGSEIFVRPPVYRRVSLAVEVGADLADPGELEPRLAAALGGFLDPLIGGEEGSGWPFGESVRPSALLRRAQQALGDAGEVLAVAVGLDGAPPQESCRDRRIAPHELVVLERLVLRLQRRAGAAGGLR